MSCHFVDKLERLQKDCVSSMVSYPRDEVTKHEVENWKDLDQSRFGYLCRSSENTEISAVVSSWNFLFSDLAQFISIEQAVD